MVNDGQNLVNLVKERPLSRGFIAVQIAPIMASQLFFLSSSLLHTIPLSFSEEFSFSMPFLSCIADHHIGKLQAFLHKNSSDTSISFSTLLSQW